MTEIFFVREHYNEEFVPYNIKDLQNMLTFGQITEDTTVFLGNKTTFGFDYDDFSIICICK